MKAKLYRTKFIETLTPIHGIDEAESFFYIILEDKHQMKRVDLALNPDFEFSDEEVKVWEKLTSELKKEIPIQYLLGKTEFFGLPFYVNNTVLIPRPETEELVGWIIAEVRKIKKLTDVKILDIGTGSGCVAISLAKNLSNAVVFALDVSAKALEVAQLNAKNNEVSIIFLQQNILETDDLLQQFDIIVSNPPYVRNLEKYEIKNNVLENEPHLALFVNDLDALIFYRKITTLATKNLNSGGQLFFEINQYLGKEMLQLLNTAGFEKVELRKDIYGNDRMTCAVWEGK